MTIDNDKHHPPVSTEENEAAPKTDADGTAGEQPPSEVAMRLNLLGKLIIPPPSP